jgi:4a-hydroxytetrahydrobiopterin dehydratase
MGGVVRPQVLDPQVVVDALTTADGPAWELIGGTLIKTVELQNFSEALAFVNEVGRLAEEADHHPDIDIRYNRVTLALLTHDAGGITQLDLDLALSIDGVVVDGH